MEASFATFLNRFAEASSKRVKVNAANISEEVAPAPALVFSQPPQPAAEVLPAPLAVPTSCCAAGVGALVCSACGVKTYCSVLCKIQDMVAHRRECAGATELLHVYAYCGSLSETERVALLKRLPQDKADEAKDRFAVPAPLQRSNPSRAPALNKADVLAVVDQLAQLPEAHFFRDLPNSVVFPHYYTMIAEPISLRQIARSANRGKYPTLAALARDLDVMASNAAAFNGSGSHVARQARFVSAEARRLLQERQCARCSCRLVGLKQSRTCPSCSSRRCSKCPACPCPAQLCVSHTLRNVPSDRIAAAGTGDDLTLAQMQRAIANLRPEETSALAQMLAEEHPQVFDCDAADDISVELTPQLCERIKYLLI